MISYLDRIVHSESPVEIMRLVSQFLRAMRRSGGMHQVPLACRPPHKLKAIDDLAFWRGLVGAKITHQGDHRIDMADPILALHVVLEAAERRVRELSESAALRGGRSPDS
jgi:hypothetical protein